jgi:hypothetical protein
MDPMTMMMVANMAKGLMGGKGEGGQSGGQGGGGGALLPSAVGGAQLIMGHLQRAKAKKMQPGQEDPMQVTAMQEYQRRANNAMTGANISNQMRDLAQMQGAGIKALSRGGNINQFGQVSRMQSKALNDILAQGQAQEQSYRNMFNQALESVSDRRMRVQSKAADAMNLRAEKNVAAGTQGIMAGLTKMNLGKPTTPSTNVGGAAGVSPEMFGATRNLPAGGTMDSGSYPGMQMGSKIGGSLNLGTTGGLPLPPM